MRNVVSKFIGRNEKELNQGLIQLSQYYGFYINTTNCYCVNEKGSVENAVKIVRNRAFATHYRFDSLKQAQQHLNAALEKLNESSTIEDEKQYLTPYRPPFESAGLRAGVLVNKLSCISVDSNFYSVPDILGGKSTLSVALGMKACEQELNVVFINVADLVIEIKGAMSLSRLQAYKRSFEKFDMVTLDDLGYCSFSKECGEVLFNLLSARNEKGLMIISANLVLGRWSKVFNEPALTRVIIDLLTYKAHTIDVTGDSYRI